MVARRVEGVTHHKGGNAEQRKVPEVVVLADFEKQAGAVAEEEVQHHQANACDSASNRRLSPLRCSIGAVAPTI